MAISASNPKPVEGARLDDYLSNLRKLASESEDPELSDYVQEVQRLLQLEREAALSAAPAPEMTADQMLEHVRGSLRGYPNCGGDIIVMQEVDRIVRESAAPTPVIDEKRQSMLSDRDRVAREKVLSVLDRAVRHDDVNVTVMTQDLYAIMNAASELGAPARDGVREALRWALDWIADGTNPEIGDTPEHGCAYFQNPVAGHCEWHERYFAARELLAKEQADGQRK